MKILSIDIGGTKFSTAVFEDDKLIKVGTYPTNKTGGKDWMISNLCTIIQEIKENYRIEFCGIGFGGPVDFYNQKIYHSTHVDGWSDFDIVPFFESKLGLKTVIDNDANLAALGEAKFGAGKNSNPLFYMTVSTGIGGGIIIDDKIFHGADSYSGEIGHVEIVPNGLECACGSRGCLEAYCSGLALEKRYGKKPEDLFKDSEFANEFSYYLAKGVMTCVKLINPERIVIGGGLSKAGDKLFVPLRKELKKQASDKIKSKLEILPAVLGDHNVLYGAYALVKERFNIK